MSVIYPSYTWTYVQRYNPKRTLSLPGAHATAVEAVEVLIHPAAPSLHSQPCQVAESPRTQHELAMDITRTPICPNQEK